MGSYPKNQRSNTRTLHLGFIMSHIFNWRKLRINDYIIFRVDHGEFGEPQHYVGKVNGIDDMGYMTISPFWTQPGKVKGGDRFLTPVGFQEPGNIWTISGGRIQYILDGVADNEANAMEMIREMYPEQCI